MAKKKKDSFEYWAARQGIKIGYDTYGRPIIADYIRNQYLSQVHNIRIEGNKFVDATNPNRVITPDEAQQAQQAISSSGAVTSAIMAGVGSLLSSFVRDGEVDAKDIASAGLAVGKDYGNKALSSFLSGPDTGALGKIGSGALVAGAGAALSAYMAGGNMYEAGGVGALGYAGAKGMTSAAISGGASQAAGAVAGAGIGAIISLGYEAYKTGEISKQGELAAMGAVGGAAIGSVIPGLGTAIGGAIGSGVGPPGLQRP